MKVATLLILGGVFSAQIASAELVGDRANGRKVARQCSTCHGIDGLAKLPIAPHIGGEPQAYLVHQLTAFRDGDRYHEMMSVVASGLDDQSIADVAAWYAGHHPSAGLKAGVDPENAPDACSGCHGVNGLAEIDDAPNLAGETVMYIDTQLKAFRLGKRQHEIMSDVAADLTDDEIRAYAQWYSDAFFTVETVD
ncbi:c-type cytochrome [Pelagimonas varians]|uniref:Cytochrome c4 n=1 Tax=Pelagimonas varians TaxID=696760 RepID=A0A238L2R3_9RHOB|nr:c-type cytochrome [Pelagimonas varians]PYG27168.1 cytochrome c553 [Pelagimonas varians]SMX48626.1 Cytochrome c4 precursor [Pelagimonas varians]